MRDIKRKVFEIVIFMKKVFFQLFFALAACYNILSVFWTESDRVYAVLCVCDIVSGENVCV